VLAAGAFLLSRRSYEWLATRWPSRSGELADKLNSLPKYVVSATVANPAWNNSTVLKGDVLNEVSTLKQHIDGDIAIAGSFQLRRTLTEHDLIDELRLKIFPVPSRSASVCSARPATRNPCASSTPRPPRAASPTSPTSLSGTPSGIRRR
jgi:dihydrofolate reductase